MSSQGFMGYSQSEENAAQAKRERGPRTAKVKNKAPATQQITAEQILREAFERQESEFKPPKQLITDPEELEEVKLRKRKGFEDAIRRQKFSMNNWLKYAVWEESIREFERARSIFERALAVDYRNPTMWLKFAEMEMKNKFINHARNIYDRAVAILPRYDQFWYKYSYMEEQLGNYAGARQIFERWMQWHPPEQAWNSFVKFELRHHEMERARGVFERYVLSHPKVKTWVKFAKFEERQNMIANARTVFEKALEYLGEEAHEEKLFISFAQFEERCKEYERARAIYKYALDHLPKARAQDLYKMFTAFERRFGDRDAIEEVILSKRRFQYEEEIKGNPKNYDVWFDYARLEETYGDKERIREIFERAIANIPPAQDKRFWKRYIYLWINYALYEETEAEDADRAREVYKECIRQIPHKLFSFSKIWIMYAHFEVRQQNLTAARQTFGTAIGLYPKDKIFKAYIDLEQKLGNIDRCRTLYAKYLEWNPANCVAWSKFAELEKSLEEEERARALFELAIEQPLLDMPETLWKSYIDFETDLQEYDNVRNLFDRLLQRTKHVKVWISFANFEASIDESARARAIFDHAFKFLKDTDIKEERLLLVEAWLDFEKKLEDNSKENITKVEKLFPKKVEKKRLIKAEDGSDAGWEKYYDFIFPDEQTSMTSLKFLEAAQKWKKQKEGEQSG